MKRYSSILLAASSLLWLATLSFADERPHYGGTLRVSLSATPQALDPSSLATSSATISRLLFENLVQLDGRGRPQPQLATAWQSEPGNQRWRFSLRSGVSFHDGSPLDAAVVAASLRAGNPDWKVLPSADSVLIELSSPDADLLAELALPRNAISRASSGRIVGTGPFSIGEWQPGKRLILRANDQYWAGRPYIDSIEINLGAKGRDQLLALDLGKADIAEVAPENISRARTEGKSVMTSLPSELMALVFTSDPRNDDESRARAAFTAAIDAASLADFVFQGGGEATGALLPNWLSGYEFVFSVSNRTDRRRVERSLAPLSPWTLSYDAFDPIARLVADRIVLNARDAGITLQLVTSGKSDLQLLRIRVSSLDSHLALTEFAREFQLAPPKFNGSSAEELYAAESALLRSRRVIPLLHLGSAIAVRSNVRGVQLFSGGTLQLSDAWLSVEKQ